jgi:hypothetical protein
MSQTFPRLRPSGACGRPHTRKTANETANVCTRTGIVPLVWLEEHIAGLFFSKHALMLDHAGQLTCNAGRILLHLFGFKSSVTYAQAIFFFLCVLYLSLFADQQRLKISLKLCL